MNRARRQHCQPYSATRELSWGQKVGRLFGFGRSVSVLRLSETSMEELIARHQTSGCPVGYGRVGTVYKVRTRILEPLVSTSYRTTPYPVSGERLPKFVALKKATARKKEESEEALTDLRNEWDMLSNLYHPNIVTVHGFIENFQGAFLAMPFYHCCLSDLVEDNIRLSSVKYSTKDMLFISRDIARGLKYLVVDNGILHCDLFHKNILVTSDNTAVIADFGKARTSASCVARINFEKYHEGIVAPELYIRETSFTPQSESFAFGHVLLCILVGQSKVPIWQIKEEAFQSLLSFFTTENLALNNSVLKNNPQPEAVEKLLEVTSSCLKLSPAHRAGPDCWVSGVEDAIREFRYEVDQSEDVKPDVNMSDESGRTGSWCVIS
ncbi:protein kinase family protein [Parendozoicomonas sp. Alg238-R29]|uniref:protein kinase family protein n=1 Tax=Parendozoicomonas sp. Alg238-R29 TaxID=2993446 RepID=UPI00248EC28D|nr:protein kinase family protein [Parendozoicomonas sp. Alg238-R29]